MERDYWPTEGFKYKNFDFDEKKMEKLNRVLQNEYSNITGIMIVKDGYCIFEEYYNGIDEKDKKPLASVSKSILSALFGIALEQGYIESVDTPIYKFFPEYEIEDKNLKKNNFKKHFKYDRTF